jgi:hypothetical protein
MPVDGSSDPVGASPTGRGSLPTAVVVAAVMAVVLVAVAVVAFVVTGRDGGSDPDEASSAGAVVGERTAQVVLEPGRASGAALHVYLSSPRGALDTGQDITVVATRPGGGSDPVVLEAFPAGPNHATNPRVTLPAAGTWEIVVSARYGEDQGGEVVRWRMTLDVDE